MQKLIKQLDMHKCTECSIFYALHLLKNSICESCRKMKEENSKKEVDSNS